MAAIFNGFQSPVLPTPEEARLAQESTQRLTRYLAANHQEGPHSVRIEPNGETDESISIPASAFRLLNDILSEMAKGNAVTLIPIHAEMTTQQAADYLNVSRPFLTEQLEKGIIPCRKVGAQDRIMFKDLTEYKQTMIQKRLKSLDELSAYDQELGLY